MSDYNINIPCDVCLDLIPLVRDNIACDSSKFLVSEHVKSCDSCKKEFEGTDHNLENEFNDKKIIKAIRTRLMFFSIIFIVSGALFGIYLSFSFNMLLNIWIMPIIGGLGYLALKKKWYLLPMGVLIFSSIWLLIRNSLENAYSGLTPLFISVLYAILSALGVLIAALLKFAFEKEETK